MTARFVDTSILLYAISTDPGETAEAERARTNLEARDLRLSVQVLQEFYGQDYDGIVVENPFKGRNRLDRKLRLAAEVRPGDRLIGVGGFWPCGSGEHSKRSRVTWDGPSWSSGTSTASTSATVA